MKYFTPELLARVRSLNDRVSEKAHDDWDRAIARYHRRLEQITSRLPASIKRFRRQLCLHDAQIIAMAHHGKQFFIVVQLEPPSRTTVFLTFHLLAKPRIEHRSSQEANHSGCVTWMYEEFNLDRRNRCTLDILLSDGGVVKLRFGELHFSIGQPVLPELNGHGTKGRRVVGRRSA